MKLFGMHSLDCPCVINNIRKRVTKYKQRVFVSGSPSHDINKPIYVLLISIRFPFLLYKKKDSSKMNLEN